MTDLILNRVFMQRALHVLASAFVMLGIAGAAFGVGGPKVVSTRAFLATDAVHPGQTARLAVLAQIDPGYHINDHKPSLDYLIPTKIEFDASPAFRVENVVYPHGKPMKFDFLDTPISVYEGEVRLGTLLKIESSAKPGSYALRGKFTYQACNNYACLPPTSAPVETLVRVVPSSVPLKPVNSEIFKTIKPR